MSEREHPYDPALGMEPGDRLIGGAGCGVALGALAIVLALLAAGGGHGSYLVAKLLFPFTMLSSLDGQGIGGPALTLALVQFPVYGLLVGAARSSERRVAASWGLVLVHLAAAVAALGMVSPAFPNMP